MALGIPSETRMLYYTHLDVKIKQDIDTLWITKAILIENQVLGTWDKEARKKAVEFYNLRVKYGK